jgi:endonuclease-3
MKTLVKVDRSDHDHTEREWSNLSISCHGRKICQAKKPKHGECVLYDICPSRNI